MDIKELNNQTNPLAFLGKKNPASSFSGFDFSNLISDKKTDFAAGSDNSDASAAMVKTQKELPVAPKPKARREAAVAESAPDSKKETKRKDKIVEADPQASITRQPEVKDNSAPEAVVAVVPAASPVESAEIAAPEVVTAEVAVNQTISTSDMPVDVANTKVFDIAELASLGDLMFFNQDTQAWTATTGAILAAQVAAGEIAPVLSSQVAPISSKNTLLSSSADLPLAGEIVLPEDVLAKTVAEFTPQLPKTAATAAPKSDAALLPTDLAEQTDVLSTLVGQDQKLSVKVQLQEEKVSSLSAKSALADIVAVDQAVIESTASLKTLAEPVTAAPTTSLAAAPTNPNANLNPANVAPFNLAAAVQMVVAESATSSSGLAPAVSEASGITMASAQSGSEFVNAAKANAASELKSPTNDGLKLSREVVEQVKVNITKSAVKGIDKIDISLKPEDLGHIEIKMQISKDGKLHAHIVASRPETVEILQKDAQILQKAFSDAGFQTDESSLSFAFQDESAAYQNQDRDSGLRKFMGNMFENENGNDNLSAVAYDEQSWDGKSGLNIRV